MRIFISHARSSKQLVLEVRNHLPQTIKPWVDVEHMVVGDPTSETLRKSIQGGTDYVLLFVDTASAASAWVRREIDWALQEEERYGRVFLVPVVLDKEAWTQPVFHRVQDRVYCNCAEISDPALMAQYIANDLFALVWKELSSVRHPDTIDRVAEADDLLRRAAQVISQAVFHHRKQNPLAMEGLVQLVSDRLPLRTGRRELPGLVRRLLKEGLLPGLVFDDDALYVEEEHYDAKKVIAPDRKAAIARAAVRKIMSGMTVVIDAGTTTEALAQAIGERVEAGVLRDLKVLTNSVTATTFLLRAEILKRAVDVANAPVKVYVTGGVARPNTLAIVGFPEGTKTDFPRLARALCGRNLSDIAFVGVNGINRATGFTTHTIEEASTKRDMLAAAKAKYILGDSTKLGLSEVNTFATLDSDVCLVTNDDGDARKYLEMFEGRKARVELVSFAEGKSSEQVEVKGILFDVFGVLCPDLFDEWALARTLGADRDVLRERYVKMADVGRITLDEMCAGLGAHVAATGAEVKRELLAHATIDTRVVSLIKALHGRYKVGLCSNAPTALVDEILARCTPALELEVVVVSSAIGVAKPAASPYQHALRGIGCIGSDALLIDDRMKNLDGARALGIRGILFSSFEDLVLDLRRYGVMVS